MSLINTLHGTVCQTCKKTFSGTVPLSQHLHSADHLHKVQQQQLQQQQKLQEGSRPLWCSVCSISCNSSRQLHEHLQSPRHKQVADKSVQIHQQLTREASLALRRNSQNAESHVFGARNSEEVPRVSSTKEEIAEGLPADMYSSTPFFRPSMTGQQQVHFMGMQVPGMVNSFPPPPMLPQAFGVEKTNEYFFANGRGHCYVCNIELTSPQHKKQHIEGKQHKKKASQDGINMNGSGGVMMCSICHVVLSGQDNVQQHFSSDKHRKKAEELQWKSVGGVSGTSSASPSVPAMPLAQKPQVPVVTAPGFMPAGVSTAIPERLSLSSQNFTNLRSASLADKGAGQISKSASPNQAKPSPEAFPIREENICPRDSKLVYPCPVCSQYFDSKGMVEHLTSKSHLLQEERVHSLKCIVCKKTFAEYASSLEHYKSDLHKEQELRSHTTSVLPSNFQLARSELESGSIAGSPYKNLSLTSSELSHLMSHPLDADQTIKKLIGVKLASNASVSLEGSGCVQDSSQMDAATSVQSAAFNHLSGETKSVAPVMQLNIPPGTSQAEDMQPSDVAAGGAQSQSQTVQEYVFDGRRGVCNACGGVTLTSLQLAQSHLAGARHQKASQRWRAAQMSNVFNKTLGIAEGSDMQINAEGSDSNVGSTSASKEAYRFDGERGYCFACKIDLTSVAHANQHLVGRKHQMAVERWVQEGQGCVYPLYCDTCHKPFTGQESAAQHFSSEKHKKKMMLTAEADPSRVDPGTGALIVVQDGQTWFVCHVCKCPLNTREQMEIHLRSPRHLKEQEKVQQQPAMQSSEPEEPNPLLGDGASISSRIMAPEKIANTSERQPPDLKHLVTLSPAFLRANVPQITVSPPRLTVTAVGSGLSPSNLGLLTDHSVEVDGPDHNSNSPGPSTNGAHRNGQNGQASSGVGKTWTAANTFSPGRGRSLPVASSLSDRAASTWQDLQSTAVEGRRGGGWGRSDLSSDLFALNIGYSRSGIKNNRSNRSPGQVLRPDGDYHFDDEEDMMRAMPEYSQSNQFEDFAEHSDREQVDLAEEDNVSAFAPASYQMSMTSSEKHQQETGRFDPASMVSSKMTLSSDGQPLSSVVGSLSLSTNDSFPGVQQQQVPPAAQTMFPGFRFACLLCRKPMNTQEDYDKHMQGLKHQRQTATVCAPDNSRQPLNKQEEIDYENVYKSLQKSIPRVYQVELMKKSMTSDSTVIFLPTGTGKTLVAMMTISRMLTLNPTRPVLFLVDKVLLVLQQARYIINELGSKMFVRPNLQNDKLEERKLKVAVLCGGLTTRDGTPIYKHDVIVTTAAFCQNLLMVGVLLWSNLSLVVFDEAHHCTKSHPYNCLLRDYHLKLSPESRPKVLGLTASPAGRRTKEETLHMLQELLQNLGDACIATVDSDSACEQLEKFSSSARLVPICVPMTEAEMRFHQQLLAYFIRAYIELMRCSNLHQMSNKAFRDIISSSPLEESLVEKLAARLMNEPDELSEMFQLVQSARNKPSVDSSRFETIRFHVMTVGMSLLNSEDGIDFVLDDLDREFNPLLNQNLSELSQMGLPCDTITKFVQTLCDAARVRDTDPRSETETTTSASSMSIFQELLCTLKDTRYMTWGSTDSMALVLVRERKVAHKIKEQLKRTSFVREQKMRVAVVVGHGAGGGEGEGMNLRKQDKVLQGIRAHRYQIVVATSVAEEGVDIPECQLVVCLNPPTTLKAMVQMRGRARKKDSYFVVLCSSQREKEKLEGLQKQEDNMKWAAGQLAQQRSASSR